MLGGLARWLRAAGYDASWHPGIADWDLIRIARDERRTLLSCDGGIFDIGVVRDGGVSALRVPNGLSVRAQLACVLRELDLPRREPRCMACGGELTAVDKAAVAGEVPAATYAITDAYWRCARCGKLLWKGAHWKRIERVLAQARGP